ncbi:MAG: hypothetical protein V3T78_06690 [Dehalococcoidia bacterium]
MARRCRKTRYEDFQSKLAAMVQNGELTQGEADEKLEAAKQKADYSNLKP